MLVPQSYLQYHPNAEARQRAKGFLVSISIIYPLYIFFLWWLWYSKSPQAPFHFFNDMSEWLQMDKVGHAVVQFQNTMMPAFIFCWAGFEPKKSALFALLFSFLALAPIEVFDGFSVSWGFSWGDMLANALGSLFAYLQMRGWNSIVVLPKFSFHQTIYALARPDMFGVDYIQNSLKDYNGQTYWFTFDINRLIGKKILPSWLLLSLGYGAEGMYGGHDNVWTDKDGVVQDFSNVGRYRQFYISFDINFDPLVKNQKLKRWLYPLNIFKLPFPALEISEKGLQFHWLYL